MNDIKINGFFHHKEIHKYTYIQEKRNIRYVINYVVVRINTKIKIIGVQVNRDTECGSNYNLLITEAELPWIRQGKRAIIEKFNKSANKKFKLQLFKEKSVLDLYKRLLDQKLEEVSYTTDEETYEHVKICLKKTVMETLQIVEENTVDMVRV